MAGLGARGQGSRCLIRLLTAFTSASSFSFCRARPCRRTFSPFGLPEAPLQLCTPLLELPLTACSSSESSASCPSGALGRAAGEPGQGSPAVPSGPCSGWQRPHRFSAARSLSSLACVMSASSRWMTSSISLSRPFRISSFSSRSRFSNRMLPAGRQTGARGAG